MSVPPITNHEEQAVARIPQARKGKPRFEGLIRALASRTQLLENLLQSIDMARTLANAAGVQLDGIGAIVGQLREGHADPAYRARIQARIIINRSSGTGNQLLDIVKLLAGATQVVHLVPQYPAGALLYVLGATTTDPPEIVRAVQIAKAAGVRIVFIFDAGDTNVARYDSTDPAQVYDTGGYAGSYGV